MEQFTHKDEEEGEDEKEGEEDEVKEEKEEEEGEELDKKEEESEEAGKCWRGMFTFFFRWRVVGLRSLREKE